MARNEKLFFLLRFGARLALNVLDVVAVGLMGILGALTATGISGQSFELFGLVLPQPTASNVLILVAVIALLFILKGGLAILFARWHAVFLARVEIKNSAKIARYIFGGSLHTLRQYSRAEISFLVGKSVNATFSGVLGSMTTLIIEAALFISVFVLFVAVDVVAALAIALYFVVLIFILQLATGNKFVSSGKDIQKSTVAVGASILEMVDGFREIAVLSRQDFFLSRFLDAKKLSARTGVSLQMMKALPRYIAEAGLILGALGFLVWQLNSGTLGEGLLALGIFLAGSFRMMGAILPLQQLWNQLRVMQKWVTTAQEVLVKLRDEPELLDANIYAETRLRNQRQRATLDTGLGVSVSGVCFRHVTAKDQTIDGVSFSAEPGSFIAIVGPSGAGKTTLVDLILGLYEPDQGVIEVAGLDPQLLRQEQPGLMSYVPQKPGLVTGTIAENIALGLDESEWDERAIWEALEGAQLADHVRGLPQTIHSDLGSHSDGLSGGQIQRLGLARALYTKPNLVVLDEATSALDAATEASIATAIRNLGSQTTVIVIAHRLSTIQHADQVHVMEDGRILASGTFKQVRKRVPMIEEYVKLMSFDD